MSNKKYLILSVSISILMFFLLGISMSIIIILPNQLLFTTGMLSFSGIQYLSVGLTFLFLLPVLIGISVSLNVFRFLKLRRNIVKHGSLNFMGVASSILMAGCPQCVPLLLSLLGVSITTWLSFFPSVGIFLQLATIFIGILSLYLASSRISKECKNCKI